MAYRDSFGSFGYTLTPRVKQLLIANGVVFLVLWVLPFLRPYLWFVASDVLVQPWTLLTYMFVHAGLWHLLFNMLGLFFFGPPLESRWGSREFLKYYLICGVAGALLSLLFAPNAAIVGASGAVLGVMLAFAMNWPDSPIYIWGIFPVKAKWLVLIIGLFTVMSAVEGARDGVAHFAHLGGLVAGLIYLKMDWRGSGSLGSLKKRVTRSRIRVVEERGRSDAPPRPSTRRRPVEEEQLLDDVDRVLDKISREGMASLSEEERALLDHVSRRYRHN
ncbi:MAG TPA: rhomboid family intramembrane serine protease [Longimicrobiales bacterium]|nr:rhomboid family intramembrane serine protease [Longimicrobiales bacterium]